MATNTASEVSATMMLSKPIVATNLDVEWTSVFFVLKLITSPMVAVFSSSFLRVSHKASHEPISFQPGATGTIAAFGVFSITA